MNVSGAPQVSSTSPCQKERKLTSTTLSDSSVPGRALTWRKRGEVRAHQLGARLSHMESRPYNANRWQATGRNVGGELLSGLGL
jgi:hypothetical protein